MCLLRDSVGDNPTIAALWQERTPSASSGERDVVITPPTGLGSDFELASEVNLRLPSEAHALQPRTFLTSCSSDRTGEPQERTR